jgi:acetyltransferase
MVHYDERVAHDRLVRICFNDYDREIAMLALAKGEILGMIRLSKIPGTDDATFALIVKDKWQNQGIGAKLMDKMLQVAKEEKVKQIRAKMFSENEQMQKLCKRYGFTLEPQDRYIMMEKNL